MNINVTVTNNDQKSTLEREASEVLRGETSDVKIRYVVAPIGLSYTVPFPIVSFASGDVVVREYGEDAIKLFRRAVSGAFGNPEITRA